MGQLGAQPELERQRRDKRSRTISLPNGLGVTQVPGERPVGVAPNELTSSDHRDPIAGTPYHKHVPARLEPLPA